MHSKVLYILCVFFSLVTSNVTAQIILNGTVTDANKKPIPYANVVLSDQNTKSFILGTITDDDGKFSITSKTNTPVIITVSYIGFEIWSAPANETRDFKTITLSEAKNNLDEVVLRGTKPLVSKRGDQLLFNVQNSPLKEGYDGIEILRVTPNVWVDSNDAILMRDQAARVLINGRRINMTGSELSNYVSNLTSENILRVEVQTNQSANSSAVSTGGIINIILKKQPRGFRGQLKNYFASRGNNDEIAYTGLTANYGAEQWNVYGAYNISYNESFSKINNVVNFSEIGRINTTLRNKERETLRQNYQLGFVRSLNESHEIGLEVFGTAFMQEYDDLGKVTYQESAALIDAGRNDINGISNANRFNSVLNYTWSISDKESLIATLDYLKGNNDGQSTVNNIYDNGTVQNSQNRYTPESNTDVYAAQLDYSKSFKNNIKVDIGIKHTRTDRFNSLLSEIRNDTNFELNENETTDFNYKENISAAYATTSKTLNEKNFLKLGLRAENTEVDKIDFITNTRLNQDYINLFPSLYYSRTLGKKKSIAASYSRSLRRPSFNDLSDNITKVNDFQFVLGNPDLTPQFVSLFQVSYDFNQSGLSAYYKNTNDAINGIYFIEDDIAFYKKFNAGSQVQYGIQYNSSKKLNSWWYVRFSSHIYNRKFVNELGESSFEKATATVSLFNSFTFSKTMSIDLSGRYASPKADAFYEADEVYTANIMFKKSFIDKKLNLRVYFDDIFNSLQYSNVRQFNTFSTSANDKPRSRKLMLWLTYNISNSKKVLSKKNKSKNDASNRL